MRKVVLYSASSLDGFIARPDGSIDWLTAVPNPTGNDYGYGSFASRIDALLMGRKTYEQMLGFGGKAPPLAPLTYVFSHRTDHSPREGVHFIAEEASAFVARLKHAPGQDLWLVGGGELNAALLNAGLVDELILTLLPIVLGRGLPLFASSAQETRFQHTETKTFASGLVQLVLRSS